MNTVERHPLVMLTLLKLFVFSVTCVTRFRISNTKWLYKAVVLCSHLCSMFQVPCVQYLSIVSTLLICFISMVMSRSGTSPHPVRCIVAVGFIGPTWSVAVTRRRRTPPSVLPRLCWRVSVPAVLWAGGSPPITVRFRGTPLIVTVRSRASHGWTERRSR